MGYILSIDLGTSNLKAGVVDEKGHLLCSAKRQIEIKRPAHGAAEHDPNSLRTILLDVCREALGQWKDSISLVVPSAYQFGMILYDKSWQPLTGITTLLDTRARETHEEFASWIDAADVYKRTGCPPFPQHPLCRLFYFKKKDRALFDKIQYVLSGKAWLLKQITGEFISDPSTESASQLMSVKTHNWDEQLIKNIGLDSKQLPKPVDGKSQIFSLDVSFRQALGLRESVKALPGVYDGGALAIGLGGLENGVGVSNIGTSGMLRKASTEPTLDSTGKMRFQTYYLVDGIYLVGAAINNATSPLGWLKENLISDDYQEIEKLIGLAPVGSKGLYFLPYLTGEREPKLGHLTSGVLFGMREFHSRADILRSLSEGVAYSLNLIREAFNDNGMKFEEIRMGGGGAKFGSWVQIFSEVLNAKIVCSGCEEAPLIGSAILGFTGQGEYDSIAQASANMVETGKRYVPEQANVEKYKKFFSFYKELYSGLENLYRAHAHVND